MNKIKVTIVLFLCGYFGSDLLAMNNVKVRSQELAVRLKKLQEQCSSQFLDYRVRHTLEEDIKQCIEDKKIAEKQEIQELLDSGAYQEVLKFPNASELNQKAYKFALEQICKRINEEEIQDKIKIKLLELNQDMLSDEMLSKEQIEIEELRKNLEKEQLDLSKKMEDLNMKPFILSPKQQLKVEKEKKQQQTFQKYKSKIKSRIMEFEIFKNLLARYGQNNICAKNFVTHSITSDILEGLDLAGAGIDYTVQFKNQFDLPQDILIEDKQLKTVPSLLWGLKSLKKLSLKNNFLVNVSFGIGNLKKLEILDLSNNQLVGLPKEICYLKNLKVLDLSHNNLKYLPENIGNLENLELLDLRGNDTLQQEEKARIFSIFGGQVVKF